MASTGSAFAVAGVTSGLASMSNAYAQSQALKASGAYQKNLANINKNFAELSSDEAMRRGGTDAARVQKGVHRVIGSQRAALAAQGIDLGEGTAQQIIDDTRTQGALDVVTVKNNAFREAWGYKVSALQATFQGEIAKSTADFSARTTLLTGGMEALGSGLKAYSTYKDQTTTRYSRG